MTSSGCKIERVSILDMGDFGGEGGGGIEVSAELAPNG